MQYIYRVDSLSSRTIGGITAILPCLRSLLQILTQ